jgi:hypothetical protein
MDTPSPSIRDLARRLLAAEAATQSAAETRVHPEKTDGTLEGFEKFVADAGNSGVGGSDAAVAITVHLLWLLVTFIGEPLTVRLAREAWPDASLDKK